MVKSEGYSVCAVLLALFVGPLSWAAGGSFLNYNVVATGSLTTNSHIDGTTCVNNLATQNQPNFAQSAAAGQGDTLDVAGSVSGGGLTLGQGVFRHAGALPGGFTLNLNNGSSQITDPTLSITGVANQMNSTAAYYGALAATPVAPSNGNINFTSGAGGLSVYSATSAALSGNNETISINAATGSSLLIVVSGDIFNFNSSEHISLTGSGQRVMWYFPTATAINLGDSTWNGSILAPKATLTDNNQNINGGVYVSNFNQTAEVHLSDPSLAAGNPLFNGPIAPVPAPAALPAVLAGALIISAPGLIRRRWRLR